MRIVTPAARLRALGCNLALAGSAVMLASTLAQAEAAFVRGDTQYVAALGDSSATSGNDAATWGLWAVDPGPRGVWTRDYQDLIDNAKQAHLGADPKTYELKSIIRKTIIESST